MAKYEDWLTEESLMKVTGWVRDGYNEEDIAKKLMGISYSTFREWKKKHSAFSAAVKKGKAPVAEKVENTFYSRCEWKEVKEVTEEVTKYADGTETKHKKVVTKQIPPSDACLIFALKNLKPHKWRDKPEPVIKDAYEDDGLLAALEAQVDEDMEDDSWMVEEKE